MDWNGRRAVIIGGSSGIGLATAKRLAGLGASVVIAGRTAAKLDEARRMLGNGADAHPLDVTDEPAVEQFFDSIGPFDHLVTSVSGSNPGTILDTDSAAARQAFEIKFWGQYNAARRGAKRLRRGGSITMLGAISSRRPVRGMTNLAAHNGAIEALARALAIELAPSRVNVVAPGVIETPFWDRMPREERDAVFAAMAKRLPAGRIGTAEDCAEAIVFLISSSFVTGVVLDVDGGALLT
jgi:NAD(P)-dependent dehydrogenase (short-subunit alcohol dehydrogenase family)